jgi:hypothetical protein
MFDFKNGAGGNGNKLILDPNTGEVAHGQGSNQ